MSDDTENTFPAPIAESTGPAPKHGAGTSRSGSGSAWMVVLLALLIGGIALWRDYVIEHGQADAQSGMRSELSARIDEIARAAEQRKRDFESVRTRLADADSVNKSVREEMLALGERSRHLEDAVANLVEQRLTGRDALALNEAEFLLQQAQERLALFQDAQAAISAYTLADSALAAAEDPVFSSVRETIGAERRALEASKPVETHAAISAIERVRAMLPSLPTEHSASDQPASASRWQNFLAQFVRISTTSETDAHTQRDIGLIRSLVAIDLRAAEAALLARDAEGYKQALQRARAGLVAGFDAQSAPVKEALAELDRRASEPLAPALPELGSALKELRNLRATRALAQPPLATPAQTPPPSAEKPGAIAPKKSEADA